MEALEVGQIVSTQGIHGEVRVNPWCDSPEFLLQFDCVYFEKDGKPVIIEESRSQKNVVIIKFEGIDTVEEAQKLRNQILYIDKDGLELGENTYFVQDLIGLTVIDHDDNLKVYGTLTEVSETGANDVYHIKAENGKMYYIPAIKKVVITTNITKGNMTIRPIEGLFED